MIKIKEEEYLDSSQFSDIFVKQLSKYGIPKDKNSIKESVYKAAKERLITVFNDKCAYCEIKSGDAFDVDHYRPKREVSEDLSHSGYFWLAHEWSNLLWACQTCNRSFKKSHFPIEGKRITKILNGNILNIQHYNREVPLLLNPVFDKINEHVSFKRSGKMVGIGNSIKGNISIKYYGLNRPKLLKIRRQILYAIQMKILFLYEKNNIPSEDKIRETIIEIVELKLLRKIKNPETSFIAFRVAILKEFVEFAIKKKIYIDNDDPVEIPQRELWIKYAKEVLEEYSIFSK